MYTEGPDDTKGWHIAIFAGMGCVVVIAITVLIVAFYLAFHSNCQIK